MEVNKSLPRGLRNNNPLNIRLGSDWQGLHPEQTDGQFCQFTHMRYGVRAALIILRRYMLTYKLRTIRKIVARWAPASENNVNSYVSLVAGKTKLDPDAELDPVSLVQLCLLVKGMAYVENGRNMDETAIFEGASLLM